MISINNKAEKILSLSWVISILAVFFHGKIPFMLPLSVVSALCAGVYLLLLNKNNLVELKQNILDFVMRSWAYILLGLIFILASILTLNRDPLVLKESLYVFYIWVLISELYLIKRFTSFKLLNYFSRGYLFFLIILLLAFYYNLLSTGNWFGKIFGVDTDYNYLALGLLMAVPLIVYVWSQIKGFWKNILGAIFLLSVFIPVFSSGSRRGLVLAMVVHAGLFIYLFRSFRLKEKSHLLIHYFSILLIGSTTIIILFGTAAPQVRNFQVDSIFPDYANKVKTQYTSIRFRYSTISNDTLRYRELYDEDWEAKPFQAKGFGSKLIKHQLNSRLNKLLKNNEYDRAWQTFIELRNFCANKDGFLKIIPEVYKKQIPEAFVLSDSLIFSPYIYPIPYLERDFFDFSETHNVHLLSSESNNLDKNLTFETLDEGEIVLKSNFIFVPQTENTLIIDFKGINAKNFNINFFDKQNIKIILNEKVSDSILENGFTRRQIRFLSPFDSPKLGILTISSDLYSKSKFEFGTNEYLRIPAISKPQIKRSSIINPELFLAVNQYIGKSSNIDSLVRVDLSNFIINPSIHSIKFKNYGAYSRIIEQSNSLCIAESLVDNNFARIHCIVPSLPGMIYKINFNVVSERKPEFYIKRYPEHNPYHFKFREIKKTIVPLPDGKTYNISYQYKVENSTSGFGLLVIGIQNASKLEQFVVSNLSYKLVDIEKIAGLTDVQRRFYQPTIDVIKKNNLKENNQIFGKFSSYFAAKANRIKRLTDLQTKNTLELLSLNKLQKDSIYQFINQKNAHPVKFRNYGSNSEYLNGNQFQQFFQVPQDGIYTRAYSVLPAISNIDVNFECKFIGHSRPKVYTKRSPESNPYTFGLVYDSVQITSLSDTSYFVNYKFQVKESNSGIGYIIIGYENSLKNEKFSIADAKYKLTQIKDSAFQVNSFQYKFLRNLIDSENNGLTNNTMGLTNGDLIQWQDSLSSDNKLMDSRIQRWKFASFYFKRYHFIQKLFGAGFDYLTVFPIIFPENGTNKGPDYPHNPIISTFLYSGILGGLFYIYFLGLSFYRYWLLRKKLALFGILYSLAFAFTFFSGNSHFSVPSFTLLSLLPFAFPIKKKINNSIISNQKQELPSKT